MTVSLGPSLLLEVVVVTGVHTNEHVEGKGVSVGVSVGGSVGVSVGVSAGLLGLGEGMTGDDMSGMGLDMDMNMDVEASALDIIGEGEGEGERRDGEGVMLISMEGAGVLMRGEGLGSSAGDDIMGVGEDSKGAMELEGIGVGEGMSHITSQWLDNFFPQQLTPRQTSNRSTVFILVTCSASFHTREVRWQQTAVL